MARKPAYDMIEIHSGKHPAWQDIDNRFAFEEDIRIHLYEALENINHNQISDQEREYWENVLSSLYNLAMYFKSKGFHIHIH
jgi:hypothetical protein